MIIDTVPDSRKQERRYLIYDMMAINQVSIVEVRHMINDFKLFILADFSFFIFYKHPRDLVFLTNKLFNQ